MRDALAHRAGATVRLTTAHAAVEVGTRIAAERTPRRGALFR